MEIILELDSALRDAYEDTTTLQKEIISRLLIQDLEKYLIILKG